MTANLTGCFLSKSPHWRTPTNLYTTLDTEFAFDFDPCPLHADFNGLDVPWAGKHVFCNPPYGRGVIKWVDKAEEADVAVLLLPARTDTEWFHRCLAHAEEIRFIRGRLRFGDATNSAPFPSIIVVFRNPETRKG